MRMKSYRAGISAMPDIINCDTAFWEIFNGYCKLFFVLKAGCVDVNSLAEG